MSNAPFPSPESDQQQTGPQNPSEQHEIGEIERLLLLHRQLNECMGGILPAALDLRKVKRVLDIECGAGGWVFDLAWRYPSLHVTGTTSEPHLLKHAQALARRAGNAEVLEQDIRSLSEQDVPPESFDLVHARFLVSRLTPREYPSILASLARRCRSGGLFVWEEPEFPLTSSPACERLYQLIQDALQTAGRAFSPGHALGITAMMSNWLEEAGCRITLDAASAVDVSGEMKGHPAFLQLMQTMCKQMRSFLLQSGVSSARDYEELCEQAQQEAASTGFRGLIYVRTIVGTADLTAKR